MGKNFLKPNLVLIWAIGPGGRGEAILGHSWSWRSFLPTVFLSQTIKFTKKRLNKTESVQLWFTVPSSIHQVGKDCYCPPLTPHHFSEGRIEKAEEGEKSAVPCPDRPARMVRLCHLAPKLTAHGTSTTEAQQLFSPTPTPTHTHTHTHLPSHPPSHPHTPAGTQTDNLAINLLVCKRVNRLSSQHVWTLSNWCSGWVKQSAGWPVWLSILDSRKISSRTVGQLAIKAKSRGLCGVMQKEK